MDGRSKKKETVLIVDDTPDSIALLSALLRETYRVKVAISGDRAIAIASGDEAPDLILLDVVMPGMDGYEVCRLLKRNPATADIPVIFLTSRSDAVDEERGLNLGAEDYITKPPSPSIVMARVATHLRLKAMHDFLKDKNAFLMAEVERRTVEVKTIQDVTMIAMGSLAETRDNETGNHIRRTQYYIKALSERLMRHPRFEEFLSAETIELLYKSAPLHDIGKVGIPDYILKKPEKLDSGEFDVMKTHTELGRDAIIAAELCLGGQTSFLSTAREIAWCHHEKWDGTGYPRGLSGDDIPAPGRLMAIVDVYDALISQRVYKAAIPHATAVDIILKGAGMHFDPDAVIAFEALSPRFEDIAREFRDSGDCSL